jgi:hypothetical protein
MAGPKISIPLERVERLILIVRSQRVMLDTDLAKLYGVETKALNRAHARNRERFPQDFAFQLTEKEFVDLRCQFGTSRWGGRRYRPYAFTEQGVAMLSGVLHSRRAVQVNVEEMEEKYDSQFKIVFDAIRELMTPREPKKRRIGFLVGERPARYGKARSKAVQ